MVAQSLLTVTGEKLELLVMNHLILTQALKLGLIKCLFLCLLYKGRATD